MEQRPTKKCPYCGERIHAEAVKCRFCREFLEDDKALPVSHHAREEMVAPADPFRRREQTDPEDDETKETSNPHTLYTCNPSLWGLLGVFITAGLFFLIAGFLLFYPIGDQLEKIAPQTASWAESVDRITGLLGIGIIVLVIGWLIYQIAVLKSIHYEISIDRIEFSRGIFDRKIDNLDMFRIVDIKLHRSLVDCMIGIGAVTLVTKDKTDPLFDFEKVANPKELYDVIKVASLKADRKQGVVHLD